MKNLFLFSLTVLLFFSAGCRTERLPSEDLEVPTLYAKQILVLRNPRLPANSKEKYEAAKELVKLVDFSFTRETKTLNDIFWYGDVIESAPGSPSRTLSLHYQYQNNYVRLVFHAYLNFIFRVEVIEK